MQRARWTRPSCLVMTILFVLLVAAIGLLASGYLLRTPAPTSVPRESQTYDTDTPSQRDPGVP
ncbi:MAG TPA: hypothetical protein VEZ20_10400 [Allosphingosinicella sp.]|nr:hypothetical protein [Allosphingosinicella sp.]